MTGVVMTAEQRVMVEQHEWLARAVLRRVAVSPGDFWEYLGDAYEGLCRAAVTFDADRGAVFATYATYCIRGAVLDAIRRHQGRVGTGRWLAYCQTGPLEAFAHDGDEEGHERSALQVEGPEREVLARLELAEVLEDVRALAPRQREAIAVALDVAQGAPVGAGDDALDSSRHKARVYLARRRLRAQAGRGS